MTASSFPTRVGLRFQRRTVPVVPLRLSGTEASVAAAQLPGETEDVHLVLDWACGSVTELDATVRSVESAHRQVDLDVHGVQGDWKPFLRYLGAHTLEI